ncbi:MAG TPA: hypothetical protein VG917_00255 [Patescibacteria group bacterium]|nr:hypothetical protein [Patescibacteria group bacterium]
MRTIKIIRPIIGAIVVVSSFLFLIFLVSVYKGSIVKKKVYNSPLPKQANDFSKFWKKEVALKGSAKAYEELKEEFKNKSATTQHNAAHEMGEIIYEKDGLNAIEICDSAFQYGCYHGVLISAAVQHGPDIVSSLNKVCLNGKLWAAACQHGIGHGLIEYFGYNDQGLIKALDKCRAVIEHDELSGCADGVLMGYEFPITNSPTGKFPLIRKMESENPYEICEKIVRSSDINACYYSMPQWWLILFKDGYKHVGQLCSEVESTENKKSCFIGVGADVVLRSNFDSTRALWTCNLMPDQISKVNCLSGAYWLSSRLGDKKSASKICDNLSIDSKKQCLDLNSVDIY